MENTIAAISTPIGEGGIAIVRMSGPRAFAIADSLFLSRAGKPSAFPSHTIHHGLIGANGNIVDEVMLAVMRAPRSYTAEDVVEISCHGGLLSARNVLALCLQHGCRLAEPGEFTKRAFLNGRIDLAQAEAVADLIRAKTDRAHAAALHALEGHLSGKVNALRDRLLDVLAHIEAHIDFPEEDIAPATRQHLLSELEAVAAGMQLLLATAQEGRILREGVPAAIIGRPNVGKSSLMNALLGRDRSIVTHLPGTTRDTIEETANIRGIPVRLTDTAGIRKARGVIETAGITRSRNALACSALVLHVLNASRPFSEADWRLIAQYAGKPAILVLNKIDLPRRLKLPPDFPGAHSAIETSALTGAGLETLKDRVETTILDGQTQGASSDFVINERHADALRRTINSLTTAISELRENSSLEIVAQSLRTALDAVGEIVGKTTTEDILDRVFSTFCVGK
jgi:tRNA modification GTPase